MKREKIVLLLVVFVFLFNGCIKNSDRVETITSTNQEKPIQKPNEQITQDIDVTPKVNNKIEGESNNIVDKATVKVGDKIAGIIVKSLDKESGYLHDVSFSGSIEVSGSFQWNEYGDGKGYVFTVDESSKKKIPVLKGINNLDYFVIKNSDLAQKLLSKKDGKAKIVINNYSLGERQITSSAILDKVLEVN